MTQSSLSQIARQERTRREILHKSDLIPPLPDLVVRVLGVLDKQDTEPEDLAALLQHDQVLVAKMLAMVNSPFYGMNRAIRTIKEAVMVLGFRGVRSLVLATSTAKFLQRDFAWYGHEPKGLWLHAVAVAAGARCLARRGGMTSDECEQMFVGGLLHDIGKLLLVPYLENTAQPLPGESPHEREQRQIGLDHTEAGALVTAKWNLPEELQHVVRGQYGADPDACPESAARSVAAVRIADRVACERGVGYMPGRAPAEPVLDDDIRMLRVADQWPAIRDELSATMDEAVLALGNLSA